MDLDNETPETEDKPLVEAPPAQQQTSIPVAELGAALADAWNRVSATQPQRQAQDPFDAMSQDERDRFASDALADPIGMAKRIRDMGAKQAQDTMYQQAIPLLQNQANTIVELYKTKKQRNDPYFARIEPLFDKLMVGVNITPLVNMNEATRNHELDMRWKMARADILEVEMKKVKPEPLPMGGNGGGAGASNKMEDDPWMANMKAQYGFTDDQMKEIATLNGN